MKPKLRIGDIVRFRMSDSSPSGITLRHPHEFMEYVGKIGRIIKFNSLREPDDVALVECEHIRDGVSNPKEKVCWWVTTGSLDYIGHAPKRMFEDMVNDIVKEREGK